MSGVLLISSLLVLAQAAPKDKEKETPAAKVAAEVEQALVDRVKKLVVQLDDDSQARRDAAEKALIEIGPDLLDILPPPGAKASIELKARLARVRTAIEKAHIESFTKPSVVTLQGEFKLAEAIAALSKQSGNTIIDARERFNQEPDNRDVTLDIKDATFFEALDKLLDAAQLTVYGFSDNPGELLLMNANDGDEPRVRRASYAGLFRLEARKVEATRDLRNAMGSGLRITTDIAWEPRLKPIVLTLPVADLKATDENGGEIKNAGEGEQEYGIETTNSALEIDLQLGLPPRNANKIASVKGTFTALVPGRVEKFEFSGLDKAKNVALQRGTCVVTLEQLRKNDEVHEIRCRLKFDEAANALESHRAWIGNNPAYIIDGQGNKIDNGGFSPSLVADNEALLNYIFDLSEVDISKCRFVYETPAALFKVPVTFELKDLELP